MKATERPEYIKQRELKREIRIEGWGVWYAHLSEPMEECDRFFLTEEQALFWVKSYRAMGGRCGEPCQTIGYVAADLLLLKNKK